MLRVGMPMAAREKLFCNTENLSPFEYRLGHAMTLIA
jgi:hypothetical protein